MQAEDLTQWVPIFRDLVIVVLAAFILVFETVITGNPNPYLVGAALTLLGAPAAIRVDALRRKSGDDTDEKR